MVLSRVEIQSHATVNPMLVLRRYSTSNLGHFDREGMSSLSHGR